MCGSWISTWPIAFYVLSLATDSFEELIMIRGPLVGASRQLTCVAEDDGSALVLNLQVPSFPRLGTPTTRSSDDTIVIDNSTADYSRYWKLTHTFKSPMGPVFDYRWEGFFEHPVGYGDPKVLDQGYYYTVINRGPQSGTIVFSARGLGNIHMILCEEFKPWDVSCARITITAGPEKTTSNPSLRNAGPSETTSSEDCQNQQKYRKWAIIGLQHFLQLDQPLISEYEWRTFIFVWKKSSMRIQIYNNGCVFFVNGTRVDFKNYPTIFIAASSPGLVRPHSYEYLQTTHRGTTLLTRRFQQNTRDLCIELLVSLCPECQLEINVANSGDYQRWTIGTISGDTKSAFRELPTWRLERLNVTLPNFHATDLKLEISTQTNGGAVDGRWAIHHFRKCPPVGALRKSSSSITGSWNGTQSVYPIGGTSCQKLSYTENSVVKGDNENPHKISSNLLESLRKKIDPHLIYDATKWYRERSFCDQTGCTCAPGFNGSDCQVACNDGFYGYACQERCGNCKPGTCSTTTGFCTNCTDHYLPPNCKTILQLQDVMNADQTTAMLHLPYYPELDGGKIESLHFELKTSDENWMELVAETPNTTVFDVRLCGLVPGTKYTVIAVLQVQTAGIKKIYLESEEKIFVTKDSDKPNVPDLAPSLIGTCNIYGENTRTSPSFSSPKASRPSDPLNLKVTSRGKGRIMVKWDHPPYICKRISRFTVKVTFWKSNLRNRTGQGHTTPQTYVVKDDEQAYNVEFNLWTSTCYKLLVQPIYTSTYDYAGKEVKAVFQVPSSMGFSDGEVPKAINHGTFINLQVPALFNITENSHMLVVVKGSLPCNKFANLPNDMRDYLNMTASETGWIAEDISISENTPQNLTIGKNSTELTSEACPLPPAEDYVVVIVLQVTQVDRVAITVLMKKPGSNDGENEQLSIVWIFILSILMICIFLLFIWRRHQLFRKRRNSLVRMEVLPSVSYNGMSSSLSQIDKREERTTTNARIGENLLYEHYPHPMKLKTFEKNVQMAVENGKIDSDFAMLPKGLVRPCHNGSLEENKSKNRNGSLIAYDDTRVKLNNLTNDSQSDYINANYIQGYHEERSYIATQGPIPETISDFWRMIWQEEVRVICMLVNVIEGGKTMCEKYWPEIGKTVEYGHITVLNLEQHVYAHYTYRTLQLTTRPGTELRKVKHLQYTGWPEQGVPMYSHSIVEYLNELRATTSGSRPIVVHCSTGSGRTGTIILCDICLHYAAAEGTADLLAEAVKMYTARANMLDNVQQYLLAHLMPTQCLLLLPTKIPCGDLSLAKIEELKKDVPVHMERLYVSSWKDKALYPLKPIEPPKPDHLVKNRFPKHTPDGDNLVKLKRYPPHDSSSEYISAISVDGIRVECQYLASQLPLPSTFADFWRLVAEKRVQLIVVLQHPGPKDADCIDIIPREAPFNPVPHITVEAKKASDHKKHFTTDYLLLTDESETEARTQNITVLTCNNWSLAEDAEPPPPETLVSLWSASERVSRTEGPTLVLCHDGVTGCGLYMALSVLLERMALEQECDVVLAVRVIRRSRAQYIYAKEQFEYLYDAAMNFADGFQNYANFM